MVIGQAKTNSDFATNGDTPNATPRFVLGPTLPNIEGKRYFNNWIRDFFEGEENGRGKTEAWNLEKGS